MGYLGYHGGERVLREKNNTAEREEIRKATASHSTGEERE